MWPASFRESDRLCWLFCFFYRESHAHFEQIPVDQDLKGSALKLCQALGDSN